MYLKKIEMFGFKSFAEKTVIDFQEGITGIVGPNGCGKSNISDGVRWVLGEQSVKSLRGQSMSDVIFSGSDDRKALQMAEVTLVFDNSDRYIDNDYNEIQIMRRIYRTNNESEYFINSQSCRLKDIVDLLMDTGLGKDSLSIISQGNISSFADSKPEDRRGIFEEAAGVAKYKKRKIEAIRKLERTKENLDRVEDIVYELERQINPLRRQKEKAEQYIELKDSLKDIEISLIVNEAVNIKDILKDLKQEIENLNFDELKLQNDILIMESNVQDQKSKMFTLDNEINLLQGNLLEIVNDVTSLEARKIEIDQKRKHIIEMTDQDDIMQKIENTKLILDDLMLEYQDRIERFNKGNQEIDELVEKQQHKNIELADNRQQVEQRQIQLNRLKSRREFLTEQIESKSNYIVGVKSILEAKNSLHGIIGVIADIIQVEEVHQIALSTAFGASLQNVITKTEQDAREAIKFLKNNQAGRATFLPLTSIQARDVRSEHLLVATNTKGFIGKADDLVVCDEKYRLAIQNLLGNVLITTDLETANEVSKNTFARYKVVTLTGDVVNVGGSMTGGAVRNTQTNLNHKKELEAIELEITETETQIANLRKQATVMESDLRVFSNDIIQKRIANAKLEEYVQNKKNKLEISKAEFEALSNQSIELDNYKSGNVDNEVIVELNEATMRRDNVTEEIKSKRELRMHYVNESEKIDGQLRSQRQLLNSITKSILEQNIKATKLETELNNSLDRLNIEYKMTFDFAFENFNKDINILEAKQDVLLLRQQIESLGSINIDSIEEYKNVSERYDYLSSQKIDLINAQNSILKAIEEMDDIMVEKFTATFDIINSEFNIVFRKLFGGGKASLRYTDPDNILETGIDVDVQPPGKAVTNMSLFSGGEKALIAISVLFAILRARPVPMCILDEVEAALDQANVERFAKYLKEFSSLTQFIVVTHRPGTMEQCDLLYGATMQEKGVTKLISVKLEDAKSYSIEN